MSLLKLRKRILEISYKHKLSHIGSCLTCVGILNDIYKKRKPDEPVILSCGHAGLALYVILEAYLGKNAEELFIRHGVHPNKDLHDEIYCSSGSLGQGITIAVGRALAVPSRKVHCVVSDGEITEGSVAEAFRYIRKANIKNCKVYVNWNGYGAYGPSDYTLADCFEEELKIKYTRIEGLGISFLKGQDAHYYVMKDEDWKWVEANYAKGL